VAFLHKGKISFSGRCRTGKHIWTAIAMKACQVERKTGFHRPSLANIMLEKNQKAHSIPI
jgi:hypothetical protein